MGRSRLRQWQGYAGPTPRPFDKTYMQSGLLPPSCEADKCAEHLIGGACPAMAHWFCYGKAAMPTAPREAAGCTRPVNGDPANIALAADCASDLSQLSDKDLAEKDTLGGGDNTDIGSGRIAFRLRSAVKERLFWWRNAPIGDVSHFIRSTYHSTRVQLQSFCNVQQHALPIRPHGSSQHVHVAVGFVDLGELAETLGQWQSESGGEAGLEGSESGAAAMRLDCGSRRTSVKWVGYEASAHACALAMVIAQMLKDEVPVDSVVQVCD